MRYAVIAVGFCAILVAYVWAAVLALGWLVMSHCVLSDAQIAAGETCIQPADQYFWPAVIVLAIGLGCILWLFLHRVLRRLPGAGVEDAAP